MMITESEDGKSPASSQNQNFNRVAVIREYTYDETNVLGKQNEARILRAEMKEELVRQIVLRTIATLARSVSSSAINDPIRHIASFDRLNTTDNLVH